MLFRSTGQAARSRTTGATTTSGADVYAEISRSGRAFTYTGSYLDRGAAFDPQLGYVDRVDIRQTEHEAGYLFHPSGRRVLSFGPTISTWADWNHRGERQDWYVEPGVEILLAGPVALHVSRVERNEVFQNLAFRQHQTKVAIQDGRKGSLTFSGSISAGTSVNYQPREGRPPAPASSHEESISVSWRPEPRLRVDEIAFFTRLSQAEGRVFDNTLSRTRVNFQFTRRLSARGIVDYAAVTPDPALARQPLSRQLTSDLLVTYLVDPFTALYVGYSDLRENVDVVASPVRHLTTPAGLTMSTGRQVFVKVTIGMRF